jgi:hypothetical protein
LRVAALSFAEQKVPLVPAESAVWKGTAKKVAACGASIAALAGTVVAFVLAPLVVSLIALAATAVITAIALHTLRKQPAPSLEPLNKPAAIPAQPKRETDEQLINETGEKIELFVVGRSGRSGVTVNGRRLTGKEFTLGPTDRVVARRVHDHPGIIEIRAAENCYYIDEKYAVGSDQYCYAVPYLPHKMSRDEVIERCLDLLASDVLLKPTCFGYTEYDVFAFDPESINRPEGGALFSANSENRALEKEMGSYWQPADKALISQDMGRGATRLIVKDGNTFGFTKMWGRGDLGSRMELMQISITEIADRLVDRRASREKARGLLINSTSLPSSRGPVDIIFGYCYPVPDVSTLPEPLRKAVTESETRMALKQSASTPSTDAQKAT